MGYDGAQTIRKKIVGGHLRRLRKAAGLEIEDVIDAMGMSRTAAYRQDAGGSSVSIADMEKYLRLYKVEDTKLANHLIHLARSSGQTYWRREYANKVASFQLEIADLEDMSITVSGYDPVVVPGVLQTDEYATCILAKSDDPNVSSYRSHSIDSVLSLRARRREILFEKGAENVQFIIGEGAFHHLVGDDDVMCRQMQYLASIAREGYASIKILPFTSGLPAGAMFPFRIFLTSEEPLDGVLYFDIPFVDSMISGKDELHRIVSARQWFSSLNEAVFSQDETLRYLEKRFGAVVP